MPQGAGRFGMFLEVLSGETSSSAVGVCRPEPIQTLPAVVHLISKIHSIETVFNMSNTWEAWESTFLSILGIYIIKPNQTMIEICVMFSELRWACSLLLTHRHGKRNKNRRTRRVDRTLTARGALSRPFRPSPGPRTLSAGPTCR